MGIDKFMSFMSNDGIVSFNNKRATVLDTETFHFLFYELLKELGNNTVRELLLKSGYSAGYSDAIHFRESCRASSEDIGNWFELGLEMVKKRGIGSLYLQKFEADQDKGNFLAEVIVKNSFEIEQQRIHGESKCFCFYLQGYVSGFASVYMGVDIYFHEMLSLDNDTGRLLYLGKPISEWDKHIQKDVKPLLNSHEEINFQKKLFQMKYSEAKYRDFFENAPIMYCNIDKSNMITECNHTGCDILKCGKGEIVGENITKFIKNFDAEKFWSICELNSGIKNMEGTIVANDGSEIYVSIDATVSFSCVREIESARCAIIDISDRKILEIQLKEKNEMLTQMNKIDALTTIYNRRYLMEIFESEFEKAERYNYPLSMMILDLDRFKQINDYFGHQVGDKVLRKVADLIRSNVRKGDIVARFGGEEFIVIAPCTELNGVNELANKVRTVIETRSHIEIEDDVIINVTASFGVATYQNNNYVSLTEFVQAADDALLKSKRNGRNRVTVSSSSE